MQYRGDPHSESQSNGEAETAVQVIEDQARTLKLAIEARIKRAIPCTHPVMRWIVEYSRSLLTKYDVDSEGETTYSRLHAATHASQNSAGL